MMSVEDARDAIDDALALLPDRMDSPEGRVMLFAIGLQESRFIHRRQMGNGPARGFWQFERGGGVRGVLTHRATKEHARFLCRHHRISAGMKSSWQALEYCDVLAAGFARLLLWSDPLPLPEIGNAQAAWDLYIRTWRPGKPHRHTWDELYEQAISEVRFT